MCNDALGDTVPCVAAGMPAQDLCIYVAPAVSVFTLAAKRKEKQKAQCTTSLLKQKTIDISLPSTSLDESMWRWAEPVVKSPGN